MKPDPLGAFRPNDLLFVYEEDRRVAGLVRVERESHRDDWTIVELDAVGMANAGDIKPHEVNLSHWFDLAWNPAAVRAQGQQAYLHDLAQRLFGTWSLGYEREEIVVGRFRNRIEIDAGMRVDF